MEIIKSLSEKQLDPVVMTIGNFDGVHLGHQKIIKRVKETSEQTGAKSCVLTFQNHPSTVLKPQEPTPLLCSIPHKLKLINDLGIDKVILLPFTQEFSQTTAQNFLERLKEKFPLTHLILGYDATLGKDRQGDKKMLQELAQKLHFSIEYIEEQRIDDIPISSRSIRAYLKQGNLKMVEKMLGRPFSIYRKAVSRAGVGNIVGFPTAKLEIEDLCLPPHGIYAVKVKENEQTTDGISIIGVAPTMRKAGSLPILEVFLFNHHTSLYRHEKLTGKNIEVILYHFLRSEIKFPSFNDWRLQFNKDIENAKEILTKNY